MKRRLAIVAVFVLVAFAYFGPPARGQAGADQPGSQTTPVTTVPGTVPTVAPNVASQKAVAVTTVPSPASPTHVPEQIEWGLAASFLMRFVMRKGWLAFITPAATERMKVVCGFVVAAITAAGIHFAVSGNFMDGGASITISGLSFDAFKDIGFQWISQQAWYEALVKRGGMA